MYIAVVALFVIGHHPAHRFTAPGTPSPENVAGVAVSGQNFWEQYPDVDPMAPYRPMIRFSPEWNITRLERSKTYMFKTPWMIQQGEFSRQGNHYHFHALMAQELEKADVLKLFEEMSPSAVKKARESYLKSIDDFDGDFDPNTGALTITYEMPNGPQSWDLHAYTEGDNKLPRSVSDAELGLVGVWHAPCPFPERLDARWRAKIGGTEGLQQFVKEAGASDGAEFDVILFRRDGSFRDHTKIGTWSREGNVVTVIIGIDRREYVISKDGSKLLAGGRPVYQRD